MRRPWPALDSGAIGKNKWLTTGFTGLDFFKQEVPCSNPRESKSTCYYFASYSLNCMRKRNKNRKKEQNKEDWEEK